MVPMVDYQAFFGLPPKGLRPKGPGENLANSPDESSAPNSSSQHKIKPAHANMGEDANECTNDMCDTYSSDGELMDIDMPHQLLSSHASERRACTENQHICSRQLQEVIEVLRAKNEELRRTNEAQRGQLDSAIEDLGAKSS